MRAIQLRSRLHARRALLLLTAFLLAMHAGTAEAALDYGPGFCAGLGDGFLSLLKLLVSPVFEVSILDRSNAQSGFYVFGYYLGVIVFALAAGTAASPGRGALSSPRR